MAIQRVIVWGFMASGKSAVGARLAQRLGWSHLDLDAAVVQRAGRSIADIFQHEGEAAFRALEAQVTRDQIQRREVVISPGGGWAAQPDLVRMVPPASLTVWLRVGPETVLQRVRAEPGGAERPLLRVPDPEAAVRRLLREREPLYRQADATVDTDGRGLIEIVDEILSLVRASGAARQSIQQERDAQQGRT